MRIISLMKFLPVVVAILLTGCASGLTSSAYSRDQARRAMEVQIGSVEHIREVKIEGTATGRGLSVGASAGGMVGAIAGLGAGNGRGSLVGSIIGSVAGGLIGAAAEESVTARDGIEITVRLDNGKLLAVTQEKDQAEVFNVGDRVRVLSDGSVTRVVRD
jgi:outer membrane lipoprotein SlyB